ncbi:MAG: ATP-binding cassette domain-containing protein [Candidatus Izemoplasmataceae bacterium]
MLKLENVSKYYRSNDSVTQALRRISLSMHIGEFVVITGESGSGKSTLLNVISGLDTYEEGELYINGEETSYYSKEDWEHYRSQYIGFIFQSYNIIDSYTVFQNVMAALTIQGYEKEKRKTRALELIKRVGLLDQAHQKSSTLSGGQKQRVSIARALAKDSPIIVADEPTGNLDKESGKNIIELLKEISLDKLVVMVTHSYDEVKTHATRRIRLFDGEIVEDKAIKKTEEKTIEVPPLKSGMTYTERLMMAFRNLFSMPKRLILSLSIGIFIITVFSFSYGSYVQGINDSNISSSWHPIFNNNDPSRLVVVRWDEAPFTESEIDAFEALDDVLAVTPFDPIWDLGYIDQETGNYFSVLPSVLLKTNDLSEGRLPNALNEIVVSDEFASLGDTLVLTNEDSFWRGPIDGDDDSNGFVMEVVGVYAGNYDNTAYFHQTFYEDTKVQFDASSGLLSANLFYNNTLATELYGLSVTIDNDLTDNEIHINKPIFDMINESGVLGANLETSDIEDESFNLNFIHPLYEEDYDVVIGEVITGSEFDYGYGITMNQETLNALFTLQSPQITLVVLDNFDARNVIGKIDQAIYHPMYPAEIEVYSGFDFGIFGRIMLTFSVFFLLIGMYFLTYIALRNIMKARKKDYVIYRSIGASQKDLNSVTIFEQIIIFFIAFIIVYALLFINALLDTIIPNHLRYFSLSNYLFVIVILLMMAIGLGYRFNKRIFKESVITTLRVE